MFIVVDQNTKNVIATNVFIIYIVTFFIVCFIHIYALLCYNL